MHEERCIKSFCGDKLNDLSTNGLYISDVENSSSYSATSASISLGYDATKGSGLNGITSGLTIVLGSSDNAHQRKETTFGVRIPEGMPACWNAGWLANGQAHSARTPEVLKLEELIKIPQL